MMTPEPLPCMRRCSCRGILSRKKRWKNSPSGPSSPGIPCTSPAGATLVTWILTTVGPSRSANSAKELGIVDVPTTRVAFWSSPWATDMGVHCPLDAMSKPAQREDSATLVMVLAPNCLLAIYCLNLYNISTPPSGMLTIFGAIHRTSASPVWTFGESIYIGRMRRELEQD